MNPDNVPTPTPPETNTNNQYSPASPTGPESIGPAPRPKFFRQPKFWFILAIVLLGGAVLAVYLVARFAPSGNLFDAALSNALQTTNFTQTTTAGPSHITIRYDVSDPGSSRVQTEGKIIQSNAATAFNGYGTFQDSYMKFTTFTSDGKPVPQAALNKWFQVRKDGFDASGGYFAGLFQNDPHSAFFGDLIFGNFSKSDRAKLLDYIQKHTVYKFDESSVQHQTYKGQAVAIYDITENESALKDFNKFVGNMIGLSASQISQDLENMHFAGNAKVYVSESTKEFVHVETGDVKLDYYDYGTTKLDGTPTPQTTFEQFENLVVTAP